MKIIIAGPRDFSDKEFIFTKVTELCKTESYIQEYLEKTLEIVEGGATGVDAIAKKFAQEHGLKYVEMKAEWSKYGRSAGPRRNAKMADEGDVLIAFRYQNIPSKGTENMIKTAMEKGLEIHIIPIKKL